MTKKTKVKKVRTKTVKAWAHLGKRKKVIAISLGRSKPTSFYLGSWGFDATFDKLIPCKINFTLPTQDKK